MWWILLQVFLGWLYGHFAEYALHRWLLHDFAVKYRRYFTYHFFEHHNTARLNLMIDDRYWFKKIKWDSATKEIAGLLFLLLIHAPVYFWAPAFYVMLVYSALAYYFVHRRSHLSFEWAKQAIPWHYDHHMGTNQHANYGVRSDMMDRMFGTRILYYGTTKEKADNVRRVRRWAREERRKEAIRPHRNQR